MKRIRGIWHLSTHFLSPALLCINYDLSLGISKCYSASSLEDKGLKQRKNLQILFIQNWYSKVSKHLSFLWQIGLVLWPPQSGWRPTRCKCRNIQQISSSAPASWHLCLVTGECVHSLTTPAFSHRKCRTQLCRQMPNLANFASQNVKWL